MSTLQSQMDSGAHAKDRITTIERQFASLDEFVKETGGTHVIRKVLLANNGISAVKAIRSIRQWAYMTFGSEKVVQFVAMATPEDLRANAEYIRMADEVVDVPGGSNVNNYANVNLIVQLAKLYVVDAVWAGWGHASENPALPNSLDAANIVFIGPPGAPMHALGDKIGSTIIAQSANVPTIAWNGQDLTVDYKKTGTVPEELYQQANVKTLEDCVRQVERIGVPVMIKASEGGGGKGIRKVTHLDQVPAAFRQVQSEIQGSPIFVMKLAPSSRHLEVQLLCDTYGNAIALSGRDCSVQRRHQKILEEGPPLAAPPQVWKEMCAAAVRLAKEVGYVNAGTVEYLYCNDQFYFLELNPRLQVEHPVTEMITGVNLPAAQLQVAMGIPLNRIADVRRLYGESMDGTSEIDFDNRTQISSDGHVIAARITAENPYAGFQPTSGRIQELNFRSSRNVWGYFSVDSSGRVHEFADSQIGHLFAWGTTREHARRNLVMALNDLSIRGDIRTTVEYLKDLLEAPDYRENRIDTAWLDARIKEHIVTTHIDPLTAVLVGAGCKTHVFMQEAETEFLAYLQRGQLPPASLLNQKHAMELIFREVKYNLTCTRSGPKSYTATCNNSTVELEVRSLADGGFLVLAGGKSHVAYSREEVGAQRFEIDGQTILFSEEYDPTQLRANMGGKLLRYTVEDGAQVEKDSPFAEIEVMKMNMQLLAKESGIVHFKKPVGSVMEPGDLICTMVLDDPSKVKRAKIFDGCLPNLGQPWPEALGSTPHHVLKQSSEILEYVFDGYDVAAPKVQQAIQNFTAVMTDSMIPVLQVKDAFFFVKNALPLDLGDSINSIIEDYTNRMKSGDTKKTLESQQSSESQSIETSSNKAAVLNKLVQEFCETLLSTIKKAMDAVETDQAEFISVQTKAMTDIANQYQSGMMNCAMDLVSSLLSRYLEAEVTFSELELSDDAEKDDEMQVLRRQYSNNLELVYKLALSHNAVVAKNQTALSILEVVEQFVFEEEELANDESVIRNKAVKILRKVAALTGPSTSIVALEARQLLIEIQEPSYKESIDNIEARLQKVADGDQSALDEFVNCGEAILHKLLDVVASSKNQATRETALRIYVQRVYHAYNIDDFEVQVVDGSEQEIIAKFMFHTPVQEDSLTKTMSISNAGSFDDLTALLASNSFEDSNVALDVTSNSSVGEEDNTANLLNSCEKLTKAAEYVSSTSRQSRLNSQANEDAVPAMVHRTGVIAFVPSQKSLRNALPRMLSVFSNEEPTDMPLNVMHILMTNEAETSTSPTAVDLAHAGETGEDKLARELGAFMSENTSVLKEQQIRRVTFAVSRSNTSNTMSTAFGNGFFTYRHRTHYQEDRIVRHIETPLAFQLDLARLANFNISLVPLGKSNSLTHSVHVYRAVPKSNPRGSLNGQRYFVRALIRDTTRVPDVDASNFDAYPGPERVFVQALSALEAVQGNSGYKAGQLVNNHIFLNMLGKSPVDASYVENVIRLLNKRYAKRLKHAHVTEVELKVDTAMGSDPVAASNNDGRVPVHIVASNPTGYYLRLDTYFEVQDPLNSSQSMFYSISDSRDGGVGGALAAMGMATNDGDDDTEFMGELHGKPLNHCYPIISSFEEKRIRASLVGTAYVYDFPTLFRCAIEMDWAKFAKERPGTDIPLSSNLVRCTELILDDEMDAGEAVGFGLCTTKRRVGQNTVAMVAWKMSLVTPQYPNGREVIVIANDITKSAGSFGTREDEVFNRASKMARAEGIPRIYIAANSGARIGMADEVKSAFKIKWVDDNDESKGYEYLYLDAETYQLLGPNGRQSILAEEVMLNNEKIYKITDIIGEGRDLGVENLRGSGTIAGETSRAYEDTFTITYVSGRTVGIGAYLVRLGQRTIQKGKNAPILLTGYQALNSLMGKDVYTSNLQLGGPKVMYNNGVSHQCVRNDLDGAAAILTWLSYVPERKGAPLPVTKLADVDSADRLIEYVPTKQGGFDPRYLLTGIVTSEGKWVSGFFDKGSFNEYLAGWAKTVIVGRARLGTLPMGVIISETRTVEATAPADPATPDSEERVWQQAGQVWFPDSAYKTAQAIRDFNTEGLPLMLFANWRGFSGGQRDMFDEVLKYGSFIVDALVSYKQPIFVYIPPYGELRGGAWVVVDPTINPEVMEMYAAPEARGNVLEPAGAISIKFRKKDLIATAHRLDYKILSLDSQVKELKQSGLETTKDGKTMKDLKDAIKARELDLLPIYHQVAIHFGDLHDRPGRMEAKGVIRATVPWVNARSYFMFRLKRKLQETRVVRQFREAACDEMTLEQAKEELSNLLEKASIPESNDRLVSSWLDSTEGRNAVSEVTKALKSNHISEQIKQFGMEDPRAVLKGLMGLIGKMGEEGLIDERDTFVHTLRRGVFVLGAGKPSVK